MKQFPAHSEYASMTVEDFFYAVQNRIGTTPADNILGMIENLELSDLCERDMYAEEGVRSR